MLGSREIQRSKYTRIYNLPPGRNSTRNQANGTIGTGHIRINIFASNSRIITAEIEKINIVPVGGQPNIIKSSIGPFQRKIQACRNDTSCLGPGLRISINLRCASEPTSNQPRQDLPMLIKETFLDIEYVSDNVISILGTL